jgi:phospholipase/carboxylesterase
MRSRLQSTEGRLSSRPTQAQSAAPVGLQPLGLEGRRDGWLYVPKRYQQNIAAPFVLLLHGAGGDAEGGLRLLQPLADRFGTLLLAIDSRDRTWDVIINQYGPDIAFIDRALAQTFSRYAIDSTQTAIGGFSDGASYALSVGLTNGDLFTHIIAFSPGFMAPADQVGKPQIFISHGTNDRVLPIDRCSRRIVPQLQRADYEVQYREFDGSHTVPPAIALEGMTWFTTS